MSKEQTAKAQMRSAEMEMVRERLSKLGILLHGGCILESDADDAVVMTFTSKKPIDFESIKEDESVKTHPVEIEHYGEGHEYFIRSSFNDYMASAGEVILNAELGTTEQVDLAA